MPGPTSLSPNPIDPEELVAYLDAEIEPERMAQIETRLMTDETLRQQVAELERPFALLDLLPRSEAGENFTRTTISRVAMQQVDREKNSRWRKRLGTAAAVVTTLLLIGLVGSAAFLIARYQADAPNRQFLADLPVLANFDALREAGDVAWLKRLHEEDLFPASDAFTLAERTSDETQSVGSLNDPSRNAAKPAVATGLSSNVLATRTPAGARLPTAVANLPSEEAQRAIRNLDRFAALPPPEQNRWRDFASAIADEPNEQELWRVARRYQEFIADQMPAMRAELRDAPAEERLPLIRNVQRDRLVERLVSQTQLSRADAKAVLDWITAHQDRHAAEFAELMDNRDGPGWPRPPGDMPWHIRARLFARYQEIHNVPLPPPTDAELAKLLAVVSPDVREKLTTPPTREDQIRLIAGWAWNAMMQAIMPNAQELDRFYKSLPASEQVKLSGLSSPKEFQDRLRGMYLRQNPPPRGSFDGRDRDFRGPNRGPSSGRGPFEGPPPPRPDGPEMGPPNDGEFGLGAAPFRTNNLSKPRAKAK